MLDGLWLEIDFLIPISIGCSLRPELFKTQGLIREAAVDKLVQDKVVP